MKAKEGGKQIMRWLDSSNDSMDMNLSKLWETLEKGSDWRAAVHRVRVGQDLATEQQQQEEISFT